jgi:hypothetical protein
MLSFHAISKHPILAGFPDAGFVAASPVPHQDTGYVAVKLATGKYRNVDWDGNVKDDRPTAGAGERFVEGVGATVIAQPAGWVRPYVFAVA